VRRAVRAAALLALAFAAGCTSSAGSPSATPVAGDTSQPVLSTPVQVSTPPPSSAPASSSSTSVTPPPADPGVLALRAWAAEAARTVNAGHYDSAALDKLMTPAFRQHMKAVLGNSLGYRYPGPIPFATKSVDASAQNQRQIDVCFVSSGYAVSKKTGKPKGHVQIAPLDARVRRANGHWLVAALYNGSFSCRGVHIRKAT
jgi:hypothetical protein